MRVSQQRTFTFELRNEELQEALAQYIRQKSGIEEKIEPSKLNFSGNDIEDGRIELLIVEYTCR